MRESTLPLRPLLMLSQDLQIYVASQRFLSRLRDTKLNNIDGDSLTTMRNSRGELIILDKVRHGDNRERRL